MLLLIPLTAHAGVATQDYVEFSRDRLVNITNVIDGSGISYANQIANLTEADVKRPIDILINSPGGLVLTGNLVIQAMEAAKFRGVTIRCFTAVMAASMAFSMYHHCTERYAYNKSLFLFHPARVMGIETLTGRDAKKLADKLLPGDAELLEDLGSMGMDKDVMEEAFYDERMWTGKELAEATKSGYIVLVKDIRGIGNPFRFLGR